MQRQGLPHGFDGTMHSLYLPPVPEHCVYSSLISAMVRIKWLLVEWEDRSGILPQYGLVNVRSLVNRNMELHTGKLVFVTDSTGPSRRAKIVMASDDRRFLEQQLLAMQEHSQQIEAAAAACRNAMSQQVMPSPINGQSFNSSQTIDKSLQSQHAKRSPSWSADANSDSDLENRTDRCLQPVNKRDHNGHVRKPVSKVNPNKSNAVSNYNRHSNSDYQSSYSRPSLYPVMNQTPQSFSTPINRAKKKSNESLITYDQGTQTGIRFDDTNKMDIIPKVEEKVALLESVIDEMEEKISILEATIDSWTVYDFDETKDASECVMDLSVRQNSVNVLNEHMQKQEATPPQIPEQSVEKMQSSSASEDNDKSDASDDMVPIGTGKTLVPKHIVSQIDWNSYTIATRKLLMALFPRRTLATHSLTGKSSPAFMNRPPKLSLDPVKVNDIVMAITSRCNVKESLVRNAITTKCADENKMFRMRQEKRKKVHANGDNQENVPPAVFAEN